MKDFIFIGAGLFNCCVANVLANKGKKCIIYEQRSHIGGNCYDEEDKETKIIVHKYGPHIIHLDNPVVYNFLSKFSNLIPFHHEVKAIYKDEIYPMPINLETINKFFNKKFAPFEIESFIQKQQVNIKNPKNLEEKLLSLIGEDLYNAFFKEYTEKQWGIHPKYLGEDIIQRIPIRNNYNSSYYKKKFSFLPEISYAQMFKNMVDHENITVILNQHIRLNDITRCLKNDNIVVYSGCIDELFDYIYGQLEYRTLHFETKVLNVKDFQGISVMNYPEQKYSWTRICEHKHFYYDRYKDSTKTIISYENPNAFEAGTNDIPYYPINNEQNNNKYILYKNLLQKYPNLYAVGRLGSYKYTDMENTVSNALTFAGNLICQ